MIFTDKITCSKCGKDHDTTRHNFDDWVVCKECGKFLCESCTNIRTEKDVQNLFMWNMVSFLLFYIGISISLMAFAVATTLSRCTQLHCSRIFAISNR